MEPVDVDDDRLLDLDAAAGLAGVSTADFARLVAAGSLATCDEGCRVATRDVRAWREHDRASRRAALADLATQVGQEVFY